MRNRITPLFIMTLFVMLIGCKSKLFISGKIVNPVGNGPVAGALITTTPVSNSVITDKRGEYKIEVIEPGIYIVTASIDAKRLGEAQINVTEASTGIANIKVGIFVHGSEWKRNTYIDQDGNSFSTVKIGKQIWMAENLNVEHYRNGDLIPQVVGPNTWADRYSGAWCYYRNDPVIRAEYGKLYGKLYNWYAVNDRRGLAPEGWHIPTVAEFDTLSATVHNRAETLKAIGQVGDFGACYGTNKSGFSALLVGIRFGNELSSGEYKSKFEFFGLSAHFWSSQESPSFPWWAWGMVLYCNEKNIEISGAHGKEMGFSIRCIKD
jgi:uncharacterized protein (TIGR02145 family)